jgi:hypothetical protein
MEPQMHADTHRLSVCICGFLPAEAVLSTLSSEFVYANRR